MRHVSEVTASFDEVWEMPERVPPLQEGVVQLWRIEPHGIEQRCRLLLDAAECVRADRYRVGSAREDFTVARGCVRMLLGAHRRIAPEAISFSEGPHGKPELVDGGGIRFNVAHSHGLILIAICRGCAVGVDVEWVREGADLMQVARESFTAREARIIESGPTHEERLLAFYRCWTQKEAVAKADGRGLTLSLSSFEVPVTVADRSPVHLASGGKDGGVTFFITDVAGGAGYASAVACASAGATLEMYRFSTLS
jgi:4'-phosphopantetheinyl transferase